MTNAFGAFPSPHRVIDRIHTLPAHVWSAPKMTRATGLPQHTQAVERVAHHTNSGQTLLPEVAFFFGRELDQYMIRLGHLIYHDSVRSGRTTELAAFVWEKLDVVNLRADWNITQRHSIARLDFQLHSP